MVFGCSESVLFAHPQAFVTNRGCYLYQSPTVFGSEDREQKHYKKHNMSSLDRIQFPVDVLPSRHRLETPPALKFITSLLYKSGTGLSLVYVALLLVIQPLLEVQYERRGEYLTHALKKCRYLLAFLGKQHSRLPTVAVKRGEKLYSDAQCQTIDEEDEALATTPGLRHTAVYFKDQMSEDDQKNPLKYKLEKLRGVVEHYNKYCCDFNEIHPFNFQVKKFQGRIDAYAHVQLFKGNQRTMAGKSAGVQIKNDIRAMKGLYLTGQV